MKNILVVRHYKTARQFLDHIFGEVDRIGLRVLIINFEGTNTGRIINSGILETPDFLTIFVKRQELNIHLNMMTRHLFVSAFGVRLYNPARHFLDPYKEESVMDYYEQREVRRKLRILRDVERLGSVVKTCRYHGIGRASFYRWRALFSKHGEAGLRNKRSVPHSHPNKVKPEIEEKVLYLRRKYYLGPERIMWYMARYHDMHLSESGIYCILKRHGLNRLPKGTRKRKLHTKRYNKQVPGHHIQMDVKFLTFHKNGQKIRRFQYTAIDDATRIRALKIYDKHTQANAIDFTEYVIQKFPFRIKEIRTDNGHEFQAKFHWHVEDRGIRHAYIKPRSPQLNGKVERSHRSDGQEFYQLLTYKDDVDLEAKLAEWENFYNLARPHGAHKGKTPYEALREKL